MAALASPATPSQRPLRWFVDFLKNELAPAPRRAGTVARMVIAATLIMILCMTFRIPYAFQGAIYALFISRDNPRATLQSAATIFIVTGVATIYILVSVAPVISLPMFHFLWIVASLFIAFFAISVFSNYMAAISFANILSVAIPLWDRHLPAETNVEDTLWLCLSACVAVVVTGVVEVVYAYLRPGDEAIFQIADRLSAVESLLTCYADHGSVDPASVDKIIKAEMLGTSTLRRILRRSDYSPRYRATMGGVAALTGRLVDLAATLPQLSPEVSAQARDRFRHLAGSIESIRISLINRQSPAPLPSDAARTSAPSVPLLGEIEETISLIMQLFADSRFIDEYLPSFKEIPRSTLLVADAFKNPDHLRFALKGCLAASACYVLYNAIAWTGISTAVTTCLLTALSTVGASRQKQILRLTGSAVGGFVFGMGSQVFILPYIDSIGGFMLLFVLVTAVCSWIMTASPRLSYFGVQAALAYYLINLQEFTIVTSLATARDRVVGVLLGLSMMWLVFDQLWSAPAGIEIRRSFAQNFRLLAKLARQPVSPDLRTAIEDSYALRERINAQFDNVRALADSVLFEFGPSRRRDLLIRHWIRRWQPQLRTLFLLRVSSLKYRLRLPGFELPEPVFAFQRDYDERSAQMLEAIADTIESKPTRLDLTSNDSLQLFDRVLAACCGPDSPVPASRIDSFVTLLRRIDRLTTSLAHQIAAEIHSPKISLPTASTKSSCGTRIV